MWRSLIQTAHTALTRLHCPSFLGQRLWQSLNWDQGAVWYEHVWLRHIHNQTEVESSKLLLEFWIHSEVHFLGVLTPFKSWFFGKRFLIYYKAFPQFLSIALYAIQAIILIHCWVPHLPHYEREISLLRAIKISVSSARSGVLHDSMLFRSAAPATHINVQAFHFTQYIFHCCRKEVRLGVSTRYGNVSWHQGITRV